MFNLYWKVFFGFWFASLILGGAAVFVSLELRQERSLEIHGLSPVKLVDRSAFIVRRLPQDIKNWQQQLSKYDIQLYIAKEHRSPLSTPNYPKSINRIFSSLDNSLYAEESTLTRLRVGRKELSIDGESVRFALDMPSTNIFRAKELISHIGVQVALAFILSGLVCYVLARYLTRNIKQLSIASRALASGDLTARANLSNISKNDELSQLGSDFNDMADALESSIENQKRLVRDISHELRSPLTRLQIALELARQKGNSSELDRIEQEANRLNELIGQILAMPDDSAPLEDTIDLVELLETIIEDSMIEAELKSVTMPFSCSCKEALASACAEQLHSALENVIRNAIRYTDDNSEVKVKLSIDKSEQQYHLSIDDCGPGIPEQDLPHIFKPFYRVDKARNRGTGGYGIGLAIVKRVIERHHGQVTATNTRHGLSIRIIIPANTDF